MNNYKLSTITLFFFSISALAGSDSQSKKDSELQNTPVKNAPAAVIQPGPIARATSLPQPIVQLIAFLRGPFITGLTDSSNYTIESKTLLFNPDGSVTLQICCLDEQEPQNMHKEVLTHHEATARLNKKIEKTALLRDLFGARFIPENPDIRASYSQECNCLLISQAGKSNKLYSTTCCDIEADKIFIADQATHQTRAQALCCVLQ